MTLFGHVRIPVTRGAVATLVFGLLIFGGAGSAYCADPTVSEPLFGFLLKVANGDSLGTWTGQDISDFAEERGRRSKFPLDQIISVSRRRPLEQEQVRWPAGRLTAMWELKLIENLDRPMPYSILGYHPGSLRVSGTLVMSELFLGDRTFLLKGKADPAPRRLNGIRALRLDVGSVVLDADAIPDALLGGNLDDAWSLGFGLARDGDRQVGLAVSIRRDGGAIFGEFDFANDKIMKSGSPLGSQLSRFCREWFTRPDSQPPATWLSE